MIVLLNSGCAAALVGGLLYKSAKSKEAKQKFMANLQQTNLDREKAGLQPLDMCTEKYYFDKGWADDDPVCKERIIRYEDPTAEELTDHNAAQERAKDYERTASSGWIGSGVALGHSETSVMSLGSVAQGGWTSNDESNKYLLDKE